MGNSSARLLAADANTRIYFQPNANYNGAIASAITFRAWDQTSGTNGSLADTSTNGGTSAFSSATDTASLTVTAVNDVPVRTAGTLTPISVAEDSADATAVTLGLSGVTYGPGGGADESSQTLTYTLTGIPAYVQIFKADGTTAVTLNGTVTATELQGLKYKTVADADGSGNLTWTVTDDGTPAQTLTENLAITVTAVNDAPVRTAGTLTPISVAEDSADATAVSLGLSGVTYGPGGGADESSQTLTYTLTGIPAYVQIFKADGTTAVTLNGTVTATELQGLKYKTVANANGSGNLTWTVTDNGTPAQTLTENLAITVAAVNDAPVRTAGTLTPISVAEDSADATAVTLGLSGVTYGPGGGADESSQTLTYTLTGIPAYVQIFKADGTTAVTLNGTVTATELQGLKYKTVADANGSGNLTWTVTDNGTPAQTLTENLAITVAAVNDVPVRTAGTLTPISVAEDSADATAVTLGLSGVTYGPGGGADESSQTLTYTLTGIPAYVQIFKADGTTAVTLNGTVTATELQGLKYKTVANANGSGNLTWTVRDNGTPAQTLTENLAITVTAVNDVPVRTAGTLRSISVAEDSADATAVTLGLSGVTYGPGGGADESSQTLTYTLTGIPAYVQIFKADGTTRVNLNGTVTATELQGLKYKTVANANGSGNLTWTVRDNGTPAQTLTENLAITVTAVNDAPVLDSTKSPLLSAENENAGAPSGPVGTLVSSLVDFASPSGQVDNVTDVDSGAQLGIAITAASTSHGSWWYSTNNGTNWRSLGSVSNSNARLLAADANTRIYFQPNANYSGTLASAITFRAWDQTSGTNGNLANTSTNGGTSAFSSATDAASLTVTAVNNGLVRTAGTLTSVGSSAQQASGTMVSNSTSVSPSLATTKPSALPASDTAVLWMVGQMDVSKAVESSIGGLAQTQPSGLIPDVGISVFGEDDDWVTAVRG